MHLLAENLGVHLLREYTKCECLRGVECLRGSCKYDRGECLISWEVSDENVSGYVVTSQSTFGPCRTFSINVDGQCVVIWSFNKQFMQKADFIKNPFISYYSWYWEWHSIIEPIIKTIHLFLTHCLLIFVDELFKKIIQQKYIKRLIFV